MASLRELALTSPLRSLDRQSRRRLVGAVAALAGLGGAWAGCHPTAQPPVDAALTAMLAAAVAWSSAHARRWTWPWLAGWAALATVNRPAVALMGVLALSGALASVQARRRHQTTGVVIGALAVQSLLRIEASGSLWRPTTVVAVAVLPVLVSGYRLMPAGERRWVRRGGLALAGVAVLASVSALITVAIVKGRLERAVTRSEAAVAGVGAGEQPSALADLAAAEDDFSTASDLLGSPLLLVARSTPVVGPHVEALRDLAEVGADLDRTAIVNLDQVDYERLAYRAGRVDLDEVAAISVPLTEVRRSLTSADRRAADIDSPWLLGVLTERIDDLRRSLAATGRQADTAQVAVDLAPDMLGADGPRRYLVVFPSPSEMRGGAGFVGSFAVLDAVDGRVELTESAGIRTLISARPAGERRITGLEEYSERWGRLQPADFNQDILASPHFPWDADAFAQVADQSGRGEVDAVIAMSPAALAALLEITGPATVPGRAEPLLPEDAEEFLQLGQYLEFDDDERRSDALEELTRTTFDRLTTGSLPSPERLGDLLGPLVPTHDLQVWSTRPAEQRLLGRLDVTGAFPEAGAHDLVHVSGTNGGNSKIDVFLHRVVTVEPRRDETTGEITSTVRVALRNDAPDSGLPRYVIGNGQGRPNGTNRQLLGVTTPLLLESATVDGRPVGMGSGNERGFHVYERYVDVGPGDTVVVELELRGTIAGMDRYRLVVPAQLMVNADRLVLRGGLVGRDRPLVLDRRRDVVHGDG